MIKNSVMLCANFIFIGEIGAEMGVTALPVQNTVDNSDDGKPYMYHSDFDNNGNPLVNGRLFTLPHPSPCVGPELRGKLDKPLVFQGVAAGPNLPSPGTVYAVITQSHPIM